MMYFHVANQVMVVLSFPMFVSKVFHQKSPVQVTHVNIISYSNKELTAALYWTIAMQSNLELNNNHEL